MWLLNGFKKAEILLSWEKVFNSRQLRSLGDFGANFNKIMFRQFQSTFYNGVQGLSGIFQRQFLWYKNYSFQSFRPLKNLFQGGVFGSDFCLSKSNSIDRQEIIKTSLPIKQILNICSKRQRFTRQQMQIFRTLFRLMLCNQTMTHVILTRGL